MRRIIQFNISKGTKHYVAECADFPIVTQGKTLDETTHNIKEALECYLDGENLAELGFAPSPSTLVNFELEGVNA